MASKLRFVSSPIFQNLVCFLFFFVTLSLPLSHTISKLSCVGVGGVSFSKFITNGLVAMAGIMFQDITTLLLDPKAFKDTIDLFVERYKGKNISVVAGK